MSKVTLPPVRIDLLDPRTGKISTDWYRFFQQTFVRIGGPTYAISVVGSGLSYSAGTFTINSTPADTPSTIVYRDASGNFSAGTITAALSGNATTANKWTSPRTLSFSGDATGSGSVDGSANVDTALTLANTGVFAGSYADSTHVATFSVDGKGRITSAANTAIAFPVTSVFGQTGAVGDLTGDVTTSGSSATTLTNTAVAAGSYGGATRAATFTVDAKGRLTAASDALITPAFSSLTGKPTTATGYGIASIDAVPIGGTTPAAGAFTTISGSSGTFSGNSFVGTTSVLSTTAGRTYLAMRGSAGASVVELSTAAADADNAVVGVLQFADANSVNADKRASYIFSLLSGTTANNRGSALVFVTKVDGGAVAEAARITNGQRLLIGTTTDDGTNKLQVAGNVAVVTVGSGVRIKEGSNAKQGTAVLVAGTVTVANTSITASSRIQLTGNADGGTPGWLRVSSRIAGTSFTITSSSAADTSTVAYFITEPA